MSLSHLPQSSSQPNLQALPSEGDQTEALNQTSREIEALSLPKRSPGLSGKIALLAPLCLLACKSSTLQDFEVQPLPLEDLELSGIVQGIIAALSELPSTDLHWGFVKQENPRIIATQIGNTEQGHITGATFIPDLMITLNSQQIRDCYDKTLAQGFDQLQAERIVGLCFAPDLAHEVQHWINDQDLERIAGAEVSINHQQDEQLAFVVTCLASIDALANLRSAYPDFDPMKTTVGVELVSRAINFKLGKKAFIQFSVKRHYELPELESQDALVTSVPHCNDDKRIIHESKAAYAIDSNQALRRELAEYFDRKIAERINQLSLPPSKATSK